MELNVELYPRNHENTCLLSDRCVDFFQSLTDCRHHRRGAFTFVAMSLSMDFVCAPELDRLQILRVPGLLEDATGSIVEYCIHIAVTNFAQDGAQHPNSLDLSSQKGPG